MFGKKKDPANNGKKIKVVDISDKVNGTKNPSMWCSMHRCTKLACPKQHD